MGAYVNPRNETKESFLEREGKRVPPFWEELEWEDIPEGMLPVYLIDNRLFTAAGIAYCKQEMEAFSRDDGRRKKVYLVPIAKLHDVSPELKYYLKE